MLVIFEKLAMIAHGSPDLREVFQILPADLRNAMHFNDSLKLRSLIMRNAYFPDSVAVTYK